MAELSGALLPYQAEWSICDAARRSRVEQVIMFGSRARGGTDQLSDIDLAVRGRDAQLFAELLHEQSCVPWMLDVVRLDGSESPAIAASIRRNGVELYNRRTYLPELSKLRRQVALMNAVDWSRPSRDDIYRMGVIGEFQLSFELAWKALRKVMQRYGLDDSNAGSPRTVFRLVSQHGILQNVQFWFNMLEQRNQAVHLYDDRNADDLVLIIKERYVNAFGELLFLLEEMMQDVSSDMQIHQSHLIGVVIFESLRGMTQTYPLRGRATGSIFDRRRVLLWVKNSL